MRDDVFSQCLKFSQPYFSWESQIALFFNFPESPARPENCAMLLAPTSNYLQVKLGERKHTKATV